MSLQNCCAAAAARVSYRPGLKELARAAILTICVHVYSLLQSSFVGAIAIGDLVKSTLGPKGMDKILQSYSDPSKVQVTNDGATILKSIGLDNPAAKVLVGKSHHSSARRHSVCPG